MIVPVAAVGETVAVSVIDVPEAAEVADGVTVVVVEPLELDEPVELLLQPNIRKETLEKAITTKSVLSRTRRAEALFFMGTFQK